MRGPRVLLVNPPFPVGRDFIDYPYFVGLGVLSNAAALRGRGFAVTVADAQAQAASVRHLPQGDGRLVGCGLDDLLKAAPGSFDVVVVGLAPYLKPHVRAPAAAALFSGLRARFSAARLVAADCSFGGMHYIEYDPALFLRRFPEVDAVVKYEGEAALPDLLSRPPGAAPRIVRGSAAQFRLDDLPFPAWDLVRVERYQAFLRAFFAVHGRAEPFDLGLPTLPALTSRGCAFRCAFCTSNPGEERPAFRPHSLEYLRRCFAELKSRHHAGRLALLDGCANQDPERFLEVLDIIRGLGLRCEFPNGLRADKLSLRALKALRPLAESVSVSAESGDPEFLRRSVKKGLDLEAVPRVAAWCRKLGLPLRIHYLIGCPGETREGINRTLAHALRMKEEHGALPLVQNFVPIPGAPWHRGLSRSRGLSHFHAADLYRHFQGLPVLETPEFTRAQVARMTELFRRRLAAPRLDKLIVNLTYRCHNDCRFCAVAGRDKRHGSLKRIGRALRDYRGRGVTALDLDGGEPTLHPHFFAIVRLARRLGYDRITVTTNGRRLADRAYAARFVLCGVTDILFSLHGHRPGLHDHFTRRPGSFAETVAGIRHALRLKPRRVGLAVNTMVTGRNCARLPEFFRFVSGLGVDKVNLQLVTPFGHAAAAREEPWARIWGRLAPAVAAWKRKLGLQLVNALPCHAARWLPGSMPELGKLSRDMLFVDAPAMNLSAYLDQKRRRTAACRGCEFSLACAGRYVFGGKARP